MAMKVRYRDFMPRTVLFSAEPNRRFRPPFGPLSPRSSTGTGKSESFCKLLIVYRVPSCAESSAKKKRQVLVEGEWSRKDRVSKDNRRYEASALPPPSAVSDAVTHGTTRSPREPGLLARACVTDAHTGAERITQTLERIQARTNQKGITMNCGLLVCLKVILVSPEITPRGSLKAAVTVPDVKGRPVPAGLPLSVIDSYSRTLVDRHVKRHPCENHSTRLKRSELSSRRRKKSGVNEGENPREKKRQEVPARKVGYTRSKNWIKVGQTTAEFPRTK
ncbi:hypothetical protein B0H13DRAFT_2265727 [Mycena leptocephala]|nr:hypothetical protein B0H13DRAFT_2265727 [Mycena leptocephala]